MARGKHKRLRLIRESAPVAEAVALSLEEIGEQIRAKLNPPTFNGEMDYTRHCWVRSTYDDRVIVEKQGKLWEVPYTIDGAEITLGEPAEVVVAYQRIAESGTLTITYERVSSHPAQKRADPGKPGAPVEISESSVRILEAKKGEEAKGNAWDVLLIKAGTSGNARHYPAAMLEASVPLFEGVKAYADHPSKEETRNRPERSIRDVVGWFEGVRWDSEEQGIRGTFRITEAADWLRQTLKSAWDAGKTDLLGFSINALGRVGAKRSDNSTLIEAIEKVVSTDVVTSPGAGGRLLGVLESERSAEDTMDPEEIKRLIQEAMAAGLTGLQAQLTEALAALTAAPAAAATAVTEAAPAQTAELTALTEALAEIKKANRLSAIGTRIDAAKLPNAHAARLKTRILESAARRDVDDAEIDAAIQDVRDIIAESGPARPAWLSSMTAGDSAHDQMRKALVGWFTGEPVDGVRPVRDLRESFALWKGVGYLDVEPIQFFREGFVGGYDNAADHKRITESLGTSDWAQVFADVFYLQMIKEYASSPDYDNWRKVVSDIESVPDFRTRHWTRVGGYGDLVAVAEKGTYQPITSPGDEEVAYAVGKYGGIEDITMEMILGDRLAQVRSAPRRMAYAASRTLYKFVMTMVTTQNPTMDYDSVALYDSAHANTGTTALTVSGVDAVTVAMRSQTAFGQSQEILGTRNKPRYLIVPNELEGRALRITNPSDAYAYAVATPADTETVMDPHRFKGAGLEVIVYDQLTDATDWWVVADPTKVPTIVMGFLNGRTEPELFTQDQPNVGSMFTADKVSYKVRHIFGGEVQEHRSFYRQVVSGS